MAMAAGGGLQSTPSVLEREPFAAASPHEPTVLHENFRCQTPMTSMMTSQSASDAPVASVLSENRNGAYGAQCGQAALRRLCKAHLDAQMKGRVEFQPLGETYAIDRAKRTGFDTAGSAGALARVHTIRPTFNPSCCRACNTACETGTIARYKLGPLQIRADLRYARPCCAAPMSHAFSTAADSQALVCSLHRATSAQWIKPARAVAPGLVLRKWTPHSTQPLGSC
eukprot:3364730-Pleurochrysis_carterae.AAC.4